MWRVESHEAKNMSKKNILSGIVLLILLHCCVSAAAANESDSGILIGWWTDIYDTGKLAGYAQDGNTLVLGNGGGWYTDSWMRYYIKNFLDEAQRQNIKVIVSMTRNRHTPFDIPTKDFIDTINAFKNHSALYAWYLGDEPEGYDNNDGNRSDDWQITHDYLAIDPGFYGLAKAADPNHPIFISFNMIYDPRQTYWDKILRFFDVTDVVGMHNYPFWNTPENLPEFAGFDMRTQYDKWKLAFEDTMSKGKVDFIATCQGFGYNSHDSIYRDPTRKELRYQAFSAIVLGIKKVLFWYDGWTNDNVKELVRLTIGEAQSIGKEMSNGVTNNPDLGVSITDRDKLVYRYGKDGDSYAILAVNIANRNSASGQNLSNVQFTLPAGIRPSQVEVIGENRIIPVNNGVFTDNFTRFEVHIYRFTNSSSVPVCTAADINCDTKVDVSDLNIVASDFGKTSGFNNAKSDTNTDGIVDIFDVVFVASRIA